MADIPRPVDTSAFIAAWVERYPIDTFPPLWDELAMLIRCGASNRARRGSGRTREEVHMILLEWFDANGSPFVKADGRTYRGGDAHSPNA